MRSCSGYDCHVHFLWLALPWKPLVTSAHAHGQSSDNIDVAREDYEDYGGAMHRSGTILLHKAQHVAESCHGGS